MISSFDYYQQIESPNMYLCNPDQRPICTINGENRHCVLRFNDLSELTFTVPKIIGTEDNYNLIETKRLIFVENIGWFQITNVSESIEGDKISKSVTAESHQTSLKTRGFVTEERVYMFYNPNDPMDTLYDSRNLGAIPSVVGQLYQQLGIQLALQVGDAEPDRDFGDWTIIYIEDDLKFNAKSYNQQYETADGAENICRTFSEGTTYGYDFIVNDVEDAFQVIFEFDFLHHTIKIKKLESVTLPTNIYLSFDNLVTALSVTEDAENIVTVLSCNGNGLDIYTVNPMGTNYIVNFDYYKKLTSDDGKIPYPWMSQELIETLNDWEIEWLKWQADDEKRTGHTKSYSTLVKALQEVYTRQSDISLQIQYANLKLTDLQTAQDQYHNSGVDGEAGLVVAEDVDINGTSLLNSSTFYLSEFTDQANIVGHTLAPTPTRILDERDANGNATKWHYEFSFTDTGTSGTPKDLIINFIDSDNETDNLDVPFYFIDDTNKRSYCKLQVASEVGVVKDVDGFISGNGTVEVKGVTFTVQTLPDVFMVTFPNGSQKSISKSNSYFVYNNVKYKITSSADGITSVYCYYVSGFERFITNSETAGNSGWCMIWLNYINTELTPIDEELEQDIATIEEELAYINERCNIQKYVKNKSQTLYDELLNYWIEGEYQNDNLAVLDTTTMAERIDLANELMAAGKTDLEKSSQPMFEMSVQAVNFIRLLEFKSFTEELVLGRVITIEKSEDLCYNPAFIGLEFDLDDSESFVLNFSNAGKPNETAMTFADLIQESASTTRTVSANWSNLMDYTRNKEAITSLIQSPLDRTLRATQANMANQQFVVDTSGILGRKWDDDSHTSFMPEQIRIVNNTILFTDDNWEHAALALGKIEYGSEGETAYGLAADVLVGNMILSSKMTISNGDDDNCILLNNEGILIKHEGERVLYANTEGDLELRGTIHATAGEFGKITINEDGSIVSNNGNFSVDVNGNLIAKGGGTIARYSINDTSLTSGNVGMSSDTTDGAIAFWAGHSTPSDAKFKVTNAGVMNAQSGQIGGIMFSPQKENTNGLYNSGFMLGTAKINTGEYETVLAFGSVEYGEEGAVEMAALTLIDKERISAPESNFNSGYIGTASINDLTAGYMKAYSLTSRFDPDSDTGIYIAVSSDPAQYHATLSYSGNMIYLTIYNANGKEVNLDEAKSFTVHYACIWGSDTTWNATVDAGKSQTSINTYAFWGVSYARFDSISGPNTKYFYLSGETFTQNIGCRGNFIPYPPNPPENSITNYDLGSEGNYWNNIFGNNIHGNNIYGDTPSIYSSDANKKHNIQPIQDIYDDVYDALIPVTFVFNNNTSGRTHIGLTAQNLKEAIIKAGLTTKECAAYVEWEDEDGNVGCGIRYGELISLNIYEIQKLKQRIISLENELKGIKGVK